MTGAIGAEKAEILNVTVGEPTALSPAVGQNCSSLAVSRTGAVAAFYPPRPSARPEVYRVSTDGGVTWGEELRSPEILGGGACGTGLREGGVIRMCGSAAPGKTDPPAAQRIRFSDDFLHYDVEEATVSVPKAALHTKWAKFYPGFDKGKIVQLPDGDLLAPMYGDLEGDVAYRTMLVRSSDGGLTWEYYASVAYEAEDPNPELVGEFCGYCEPSLAQLADGRLVCVMRTQGTHLPAEYRPLYISWSDDVGKTWTKPVPTAPHLMNIWPTLAALDNGVLACVYGRPGFHVVFSMDGGRTWGYRVSFSHRSVNEIAGMVDMVKAGPNRLLAIGGTEEGTKVFPITVERVTVSPARVALAGRVVDEGGGPIAGARVERSPNRYVADSYTQPEEGAKLDKWGLAPEITGVPELRYQSIRDENGFATIETDGEGRFRFEAVEMGELILTVEAKGFAPRFRRVTVAPDVEPQEFRLEPGRSVRGRVVGEKGDPVPGICVVIKRSHIHTDGDGFFHWAVRSPVPDEVTVRVFRAHVHRPTVGGGTGGYEPLEGTLSLSQIEGQPIVLTNAGN